MKYVIIIVSSLLVISCTSSNLNKDLSSSPRPAPKIVVIKPFVENPNVSALKSQLQNAYTNTSVQVLRVGNEIKVTYLADELFGVGSVDLLPSAGTLLDPFITAVKTYPQAKWRIDSFTDNSGIPANNILRSEQRAQNVARYWVEQGLPVDNITLKGYGSDYYIASNDTSEGRTQNRRIVVTISNIPLPQPAT